MIGEEVSITVLGVKGNQVRLGINAPRSVAVHREEIYRRIKREQAGGARHGEGPPQEPHEGTEEEHEDKNTGSSGQLDSH